MIFYIKKRFFGSKDPESSGYKLEIKTLNFFIKGPKKGVK